MNRAAAFTLVAPSNDMAAAGTIRRGCHIAQEFLIVVFDALAGWHERSAQRRHLAALDDRMLSDIGCDRGEAIAESMKPFWRR
jgi:uncharacterized protein YjiS (DUF1127 family)